MSSGSTTASQVQPRYGRLTAFAGAVLSTLVTICAGTGLLPSGGASAQAAAPAGDGAMSLSGSQRTDSTGSAGSSRTRLAGPADAKAAATARTVEGVAVPAGSGEGRRVVFDMSRQRVWLVGDDEQVQRTYLVSGSRSDNLQAGTYEVYSRSRHATGIDGSSMDFMVRFTVGDNAPIGFHDIPEMDGRPLQTRAQLGTPLSHGCIRQASADAVALWRFAPTGTVVVVTP